MSTPQYAFSNSALRHTFRLLWVLLLPTESELCLASLSLRGMSLSSRTECEQSHVRTAWNLNEGLELNIEAALWEKASKREANSVS